MFVKQTSVDVSRLILSRERQYCVVSILTLSSSICNRCTISHQQFLFQFLSRFTLSFLTFSITVSTPHPSLPVLLATFSPSKNDVDSRHCDLATSSCTLRQNPEKKKTGRKNLTSFAAIGNEIMTVVSCHSAVDIPNSEILGSENILINRALRLMSDFSAR
jgi:hypothetical protein